MNRTEPSHTTGAFCDLCPQACFHTMYMHVFYMLMAFDTYKGKLRLCLFEAPNSPLTAWLVEQQSKYAYFFKIV